MKPTVDIELLTVNTQKRIEQIDSSLEELFQEVDDELYEEGEWR